MGLPKLDKITGGLQKGELFILSGEPGLGKSLLAIQIALHMGKKERPGIIYEMEMSDLQMLRRSLSSESNVPVRAMKTGYVNDSQWNEITDAIQRMETLPVYLSDSTSWTTAKLRADLTRMKVMHGIEWFVVDYLRLLKDRFDGKEPERIGYIASLLHEICKDLGLAGLAIQSMTKEGMKGGGGMAGLYGGSEQEYAADVITIMEKSGKKTLDGKDIINMTFVKNREGDSDKNLMQMIIKPGFPVFVEYDNKLPY
jgi:replicative DNA helicase